MDSSKIIIAADHAGYELKSTLKKVLQNENYAVTDLGPPSSDSVDYPDYAHPLAQKINNGTFERGILICGSANGMAMTANKYDQVRAAITWSEEIARLARAHNNANVLCLPARFISPGLAKKMLRIFIDTPFDGGRHKRRTGKIADPASQKATS